jgi:hypothetical protein
MGHCGMDKAVLEPQYGAGSCYLAVDRQPIIAARLLKN